GRGSFFFQGRFHPPPPLVANPWLSRVSTDAVVSGNSAFVGPSDAVLVSVPSCSPDEYRPSPLPLAAVACACASLIIIGFECPNHG
ncbi:hypothetical protein KCA24_36040, partial [Escherichia coli]|nr:hypothetical protein [Escherichia coli]